MIAAVLQQYEGFASVILALYVALPIGLSVTVGIIRAQGLGARLWMGAFLGALLGIAAMMSNLLLLGLVIAAFEDGLGIRWDESIYAVPVVTALIGGVATFFACGLLRRG